MSPCCYCASLSCVFISVFWCSSTFGWPLKQAAEGSPRGVGGEAALGGEVWREVPPSHEGGSPPLHGRKIFENLLKNGAVSDYFLSLSLVFKYFCTEV